MLMATVTTLCDRDIRRLSFTTQCMHSIRLPIEDGGRDDEVNSARADCVAAA
jgi:hypothetical protein